MATVVISNSQINQTVSDIQLSKTISDIKPTITTEDISKGMSLAANIALAVLVSAATISPTVAISDINPTSSPAVLVNYSKVVIPTEILPFRLSITNIGIEGYDPTNPPGIGIQIIGFSNYIL
jgi:hypothetical protein